MLNNKIFGLFLAGFWSILIFSILISSIENPIAPKFAKKKTIFSAFPQGWGFFTRNPREKILKLYRENENGDYVYLTKSNSSSEFYYGISKENRLQNWEVSTLIPKINKDKWIKNQRDSIYFNTTVKDTIINDFVKPSLKGNYVIVLQERIPQAWSKHHKKIIMPYDYAKVYIKTDLE